MTGSGLPDGVTVGDTKSEKAWLAGVIHAALADAERLNIAGRQAVAEHVTDAIGKELGF